MLSCILIVLMVFSTFEASPTAPNKPFMQSPLRKYGFEQADLGVPNFDSLLTMDAVSALMAKRNQRKADSIKKQQSRRGSFDSLLAGNGFGRFARTDPLFPKASYVPGIRSHVGNNPSIPLDGDMAEKFNKNILESFVRSVKDGRKYAPRQSKVRQGGDAEPFRGATGAQYEYDVGDAGIGRVEYQSSPIQ